jgi:hypothetical protein
MGVNKNYTTEELNYIQDKWGVTSIPSIANKLGRSIEAIRVKAQRLGLTRFIHSGEYITVNHLFQAVRGRNVDSYDKVSWIKNRGLPVKNKLKITETVKIIYIDEFWKWAENNKTFIDFSKFEEYMLGEEPAWVKQQRKLDNLKAMQFKKTPWTKGEDNNLKTYLKQFKYSYSELSKMLGRTEGAIKRRVIDLKIKERPLRAKSNLWTDAETQELINYFNQGYSWELISDKLNRSAQSCRGKYERLENPEWCLREYRREREKMKGAV